MRFFSSSFTSGLFIALILQGANAQSGVPRPGGAVPRPGGALPKPGGAVPRPGGAVPMPGGAFFKPGGASLTPGRTGLKPGGSLPSLGGSIPPLGGQNSQVAGSGGQGTGNTAQSAGNASQATGNMANDSGMFNGGGTHSPNPGSLNQAGPVNVPSQTTFGSINQKPWFMNPYNQAQLNINAQQAKLLNQQYVLHYGSHNQDQAQLHGATELTDEQRKLQLQSTNHFYDNFIKSTNDILDSQQRARFNQLNLQYRGYQAFSDPAVARRLQLSTDQLAQLRNNEQTYNQQLDSVYKLRPTDPTSDPSLFPKRFAELRTDMHGQINAVLTPEQQVTWKELIGDQYNFRVESWLQ